MAFSNSNFGSKFYPKVSHLSDSIGILEIIARLVLFVYLDSLATKILPLAFYGTRNLAIHQDFMIKRVLHVVFGSGSALSPVENYMKLIFRRPCPIK